MVVLLVAGRCRCWWGVFRVRRGRGGRVGSCGWRCCGCRWCLCFRAGLDDVDGLVAEAFGYVFGGAFLVAAEEELAVAVAGDGLPAVLVEGLALAVGLQDDAGADVTHFCLYLI